VGFEWDPEKEKKNIAKHGIDFDEAAALFDGPRVEKESDQTGEKRWLTTGLLDGKLWTVVYTVRSDSIRIISIRRAGNNERREYRSVYG